ncbi:MAG: MMPL family transporter, partial [bacterium]
DVDPDAMGVAVLFERILAQIKEDLLHVSLIALSLVFIVIFVNYRGLWHTLLTLVPLGCGAIAMVGIMNTVGLKFNIVNVAMLPLIIGIGVDYGVYMVHRWIGEGKGEKSIKPVVESTGRAVTLSAFTTMIGFASIIPAQWRGLSLMGSTLTMGICLCWIAAVLYLPSILKVIEMIKARNGRSE